jgi:hypothetical protein
LADSVLAAFDFWRRLVNIGGIAEVGREAALDFFYNIGVIIRGPG